MIFEVECDTTNEGLTDRTHTRIVSFIVLDSIEDFYIQVQLSDCEECLTVCIYSLNGNI